MVERRPQRRGFQVHLDYRFDRLLGPKLAQVYELLVPTRQRLVGGKLREEGVDEVGGDLRSSVLGAAARGTHDCEPDGSPDGGRKASRAGVSTGIGLRGPRL